MRASIKNRVKGTFHELKGTVKVAFGKTINSPRVAFAGRIEKAAGSVQANFGKIEKIVGW
jgi:uncharacterized protein YjbJ (UPF0337 family)